MLRLGYHTVFEARTVSSMALKSGRSYFVPKRWRYSTLLMKPLMIPL